MTSYDFHFTPKRCSTEDVTICCRMPERGLVKLALLGQNVEGEQIKFKNSNGESISFRRNGEMLEIKTKRQQEGVTYATTDLVDFYVFNIVLSRFLDEEEGDGERLQLLEWGIRIV